PYCGRWAAASPRGTSTPARCLRARPPPGCGAWTSAPISGCANDRSPGGRGGGRAGGALMAHDEAAARVFSAWRFPETFIEAVADHHAHPATLSDPDTLLLVAAEAVASRLVPSLPGGHPRTPGLSGAELEHGQNAGLRAPNLD